MATSLRSRTLALLAAMGAALAVPATAHAAPTGSSAGLPALTLPVITSIELPPVSIPGGSLRPITVVARPAMRTLQYPPPPPAVEFSVPNLMPHDTWLESRYLRVTWQNLRSGKDGAVTALAASPDDAILFVAHATGSVSAWQLDARQPAWTAPASTAGRTAVELCLSILNRIPAPPSPFTIKLTDSFIRLA